MSSAMLCKFVKVYRGVSATNRYTVIVTAMLKRSLRKKMITRPRFSTIVWQFSLLSNNAFSKINTFSAYTVSSFEVSELGYERHLSCVRTKAFE